MSDSASRTPGEYLRQIREDRNLGLREVARRSDFAISHAYLSQLETGRVPTQGLAVKTIETLARVYGLKGHELYRLVFSSD